jgi:hypothetical protein
MHEANKNKPMVRVAVAAALAACLAAAPVHADEVSELKAAVQAL